MPIYRLNDSYEFPPVDHAEEGILAVDGDLSPGRLLAAYRSGIFPWYSENEPIIWWAPDPRAVLFPAKLKVSKSMKQLIKKKVFTVTFDSKFTSVIEQCALQKREGQDGTWITDEMYHAYIELHEQGYAHSVEVWTNDEEKKLIGGLYGVAIGKVFFGESMFFKVSNASKYGFICLVNQLVKKNFELIDCQIETPHLNSLGAELIPRSKFMNALASGLANDSITGKWTDWI